MMMRNRVNGFPIIAAKSLDSQINCQLMQLDE